MSADKPAEDPKPEVKTAAPATVSNRVKAPKGWGRAVANAHRARARRAAVRLFAKQPGMDEDTFREECGRDKELVGLDPATIITLITIAWKLYQWWKARKANRVQVEAGLPEGELDIDFDIDEDD